MVKATLAKSVETAEANPERKKGLKTHYETTIPEKDRLTDKDGTVVEVELTRLIGERVDDYFRISFDIEDPKIRAIYQGVVAERIELSGNFGHKSIQGNYTAWSVHLLGYENEMAQSFLDEIHVRAKEMYDAEFQQS